jgi:hypothetical protein
MIWLIVVIAGLSTGVWMLGMWAGVYSTDEKLRKIEIQLHQIQKELKEWDSRRPPAGPRHAVYYDHGGFRRSPLM